MFIATCLIYKTFYFRAPVFFKSRQKICREITEMSRVNVETNIIWHNKQLG